MSGSASLTGQETLAVITPLGVSETITLNQLAALVALQVAVNEPTIAAQVVALITASLGSGINLSDAIITPGSGSVPESLATLIDGLLPIAGGTMTGELILSQLPIEPMAAVTKGYVDNAVAEGSGDIGAALAAAQAAENQAVAAATQATAAEAISSGSAVAAITSMLTGAAGGVNLLDVLGTTDPLVRGKAWLNGPLFAVSAGPAS